jgi:hypothetical protein
MDARRVDPIKEIELMDVTTNFSTMGANITLADGTKYMIDFQDIDGRRRC